MMESHKDESNELLSINLNRNIVLVEICYVTVGFFFLFDTETVIS